MFLIDFGMNIDESLLQPAKHRDGNEVRREGR
jgi:hypothetical protein